VNKRRQIIIALGAGVATTAWPLLLGAQQPGRMRRIGILLGVAADDAEFKRRVAAMAQALAESGWAEGRTIAIEFRYAAGKTERLPALAAELVKANVDVIVTQGGESIDAARKASATLPIVMASVGDAVGQGIIASLAHPGGNVTGLSLFATEQGAKRLQLIKEIAPGLTRVAAIWHWNAAGHHLQMKEIESAARVLKIAVKSLPLRSADDIDAAYRSAKQSGAQAVITMEDPFIQFHRVRIVELAMQQRIPVMGEFSAITLAGGLMSYGPDQIDMWRRAASYVDKILKGARPADLPVEQPTKFELVINRKTAKTLGIKIPNSILVRADKVIE
jgi:putative ABC transport system substrate-binding protein